MDGFGSQFGQMQAMRSLIDATLDEMLPDAGEPPHRIHAAMRHAVLTPGKRLRPLLALVTAHHLGCPTSAALPGACALELVHAASLVLDDLPCMDNAATRRGQPSVHARYGQDVAVLTGVALLNEAYALIARAEGVSESARREMVALLARTVGPSGLVGGQDKDLLGLDPSSAAAASQLHYEKTGVLFLAAVEMGALAAEAEPDAISALRTFAIELGLAFQALDDFEDRDEVVAGKPTSNLTVVLGADGLRAEAHRRLERAKTALVEGPRALAPMTGYVDLLLGRVAA